MFFFFFFFSSRRRHTRCLSDWSSDVCLPIFHVADDVLEHHHRVVHDEPDAEGEGHQRDDVDRIAEYVRSEERRVGKECRSRWAAYNEKEKRHTRETR